MKTSLRVVSVIFVIALAFLALGSSPQIVFALEPIEIVGVESPSVVNPGQNISFKVTVRVNNGQLLQSRGDMLRNKDGNLFGHWPHIAVVGTVNTGGTYTFESYGSMIAPNTEGVYESRWQVWRDGHWDGTEAVVQFRVGSGGAPTPQTWESPLEETRDGWTYKMYVTYLDSDPHHYLIQKITLRWTTPALAVASDMAGTSPTIYSDGSLVWTGERQSKLHVGPQIGQYDADFFPNVSVNKSCNEFVARFVWSRQDLYKMDQLAGDDTEWFPEPEHDIDYVVGALPPGKLEGSCKAYTPPWDFEDVLVDFFIRLFSGDLLKGKFHINLTLPFNITIKWPGSDVELVLIQPDGNVLALDGPGVTYTKKDNYLSVTIAEPQAGDWAFEVKAIDMAAEGEDVQFTLTGANVKNADITSPVTTTSLNGTAGNNNWFTSIVNVELSATDDLSGVAAIYYSVDGGAMVEGTTVLLQNDGIHTVRFYSKDNAGNEEWPQVITVQIDKTPPVVSVWTDQVDYARHEPYVVHFTGFDPEPGSGLAALTGVFNSQTVVDGQTIDLFWLPLGQYTLTATGEDYAGWMTTKSETINLIATIPGLQQAVGRLCTEKYITKDGICNSLLQKLNSALSAQERGQSKTAVNILLAFQNELKAQKGKAVKLEAYNLLMMDSDYVINTLGGRK